MADYTVAFAKHATLQPNVQDRVTFTLGRDLESRFQIGKVTAVLKNRGSAPVYFDFNYPNPNGVTSQQTPPLDVIPGADDTFVVMPGETWEMTPESTIPLNFNIVSEDATAYSVMVFI